MGIWISTASGTDPVSLPLHAIANRSTSWPPRSAVNRRIGA